MRALLLVLMIPAVTSCKSKDKDKPAPKVASRDAAVAAPTVDAEVSAAKVTIPQAGRVEAAADDDCQATGTYFKGGLRAAAVDRGVAIEQLDDAADGLLEVFLQLCRDDDWPAGTLDCLGKNPIDLQTYARCFERLPTAKRNAWFVKLDGVMTKVGGQTQAVPVVDNPQGDTFEVICDEFVNEVARLDDCAGSGFYVPALEEVYVTRRQLEVGGLIPTANRRAMAKMCEERALDARRIAAENCGSLRNTQ